MHRECGIDFSGYGYVYWQLWTWLIQSYVHFRVCLLLATFFTFFCCFGFTCLTVFWPHRKTLILNIDFTLIPEALVLLEISACLSGSKPSALMFKTVLRSAGISTALSHTYWTLYIIIECLCRLSTCQYKSTDAGICIDCVVLFVSLCHLMSAILSNMVLQTGVSIHCVLVSNQFMVPFTAFVRQTIGLPDIFRREDKHCGSITSSQA